MFGAAAGLVICAASLGFSLIAVAIAAYFQADAGLSLDSHPLFISGKELIFTSLVAGSPLMAIWYFWRKR